LRAGERESGNGWRYNMIQGGSLGRDIQRANQSPGTPGQASSRANPGLDRPSTNPVFPCSPSSSSSSSPSSPSTPSTYTTVSFIPTLHPTPPSSKGPISVRTTRATPPSSPCPHFKPTLKHLPGSRPNTSQTPSSTNWLSISKLIPHGSFPLSKQ
jgi:hypothetical protein